MDDRVLMATKQWTVVQPVVSAFVASIVRDFAARDDVLQEIAVAVLESYVRYDASRSFQAWALGIARNQIRTYLRDKSRDRLAFDEQAIASLAEAFDDSVGYLRQLEHLQSCLDQLDEKAQHLIQLRYAQDLKPATIAEKVDTAANTVSKALQRIRERLRDCVRRRTSAESPT